MTTEGSRSTAPVGSLLLLDLGLLFLVTGHFVQLNDTSGLGSDRWLLPLGVVAAACGVGSVAVAVVDRRAGRALGIVLLAGVALLLWQQLTNDGFRFVWHRDELELRALDVVLALVALVLLARSRPVRPAPWTPEQPAPAGAATSGPARALLYLAVTVVLVLGASFVGSSRGDDRCAGAGDDCVEAVVGSLQFGLAALLAMAVLVIVSEITLWNRRRRAPRRPDES